MSASTGTSSDQPASAHHEYEFIEKVGNLLSSDNTDSICHCVSEDLHMSKGIALLFKDKFGRVDELKRQNAKTGGLAVLHIEQEGRFIYYLVTKPKYFNKPTYQTLLSSLQAMKKHAVDNNVQHISLPLIGCGLDKLEWTRVRQLLDETFSDTNIKLTLYKFEGGVTRSTTATKGSGNRGRNNNRGTKRSNNTGGGRGSYKQTKM